MNAASITSDLTKTTEGLWQIIEQSVYCLIWFKTSSSAQQHIIRILKNENNF